MLMAGTAANLLRRGHRILRRRHDRALHSVVFPEPFIDEPTVVGTRDSSRVVGIPQGAEQQEIVRKNNANVYAQLVQVFPHLRRGGDHLAPFASALRKGRAPHSHLWREKRYIE